MDGLTVGRLAVQMYADHGQMITGFSQAEAAGQQAANNIQNKWESASKKLQTVGTVMTAAVTAPIVAAGGAAIKLASDLQETTNKVDVAFGGSATSVKEWSKTTIDNIGMAAQTAMDSAALYGDMATGMGMAQGEAATLSMNMTQLAGDLASFKNIQIDVAKTALAGVFTGETESLKQLGIVMTEANLKQYAMSQGITKNIEDMTQAEKINLRYAYILSVTGNAQGDFARTSDSAANQMRMAKERVKELGASLGTQLMPMAVKALEGINKLVKGFTDMTPAQQKTIITIAAVVAAIGPAIKIFGLLEKAGKVSQAVFKAFSAEGFIGQMFTASAASSAQAVAAPAAAAGTAAAGTAAGAAAPAVASFGAAMQFALGPIALIGAALAIVIPLVAQLGTEEDEATARLKALADEMTASKEAFDSSIDSINTNAGAANKLADELYALSAKENKSNAEKTRMKSLVDQLNEIYPELGLAIDETTGALNLQYAATKQLIAAKKQEIIYNAYAERYKELVEEQVRLDGEVAKATDVITAAKEKQKKIEDSISTGYARNNTAWSQAQRQIDDTTAILEDLTTAQKENADAQDDMASKMQNTAAAMEGVMGSSEEAADVIDTSTEAIKQSQVAVEEAGIAWDSLSAAQQQACVDMGLSMYDLTQMTQTELDAQITAWQDNQAQMEELYAARLESTTNAFEKIKSTVNLTSKQMLENLKSNQKLITDWTTNLGVLADAGLDAGLLQVLRDAGPEAAGTVANLAKEATSKAFKGFGELNDTFKNGTQTAIDSMKAELGLPSTTSAGSEAITSMASQMTANNNMIVAGKAAVIKTREAMATQITASNFTALGGSVSTGFANGISNYAYKAINAAINLAKSAWRAVQREIDSHSPSKKFEKLGFTVPQGFAAGIDKGATLPADAVTRMSQISTAALTIPSMSQSATYNQQRYNNVKVDILGGIGNTGQKATWTLGLN